MHKEQFLRDKYVIKFINYMVKLINGEVEIRHFYKHAQAKKDYKFDHLSEAFDQYYYRSKSLSGLTITGFHDNKEVLDALKFRLRNATDDFSAGCAAKDLMKWGGTAAGNVDVINGMVNSGQFLNYISLAKVYFGSDDPTRDEFDKCKIRSNAGFTKIHSLLMNDFVIYDSRVAAALGMFIVMFCIENNIAEIPDNLSVCWLSGTRGEQLRNPSLLNLNKFSEYSPGSQNSERDKIRYRAHHYIHSVSNIKANWILANSLEKAGEFCNIDGQEALRAIEAGLFMVGYDLANHYVELLKQHS